MTDMNDLRYTLLSDGSSDRALMPILNWVLIQQGVGAIQPVWADLRRLPRPPQKLFEKIRVTVELFPCDILFVHRDAEQMSRESRVSEISDGYRQSDFDVPLPPHVGVLPVRMTEAWLLFNESAIRYASGNTNGQVSLNLPNLNELETLPDPKRVLCNKLVLASELKGRRRKAFRASRQIHRIAEFIDDFVPLRQLDAFVALEQGVQRLLGTCC